MTFEHDLEALCLRHAQRLAMQELYAMGWSLREIASAFDVSHETVRRAVTVNIDVTPMHVGE